MTIKKKIFCSNTIMVLISLLLLLGIGGVMLSLFKDEFLTKFAQGSEIDSSISEIESIINDPQNQENSTGDWLSILQKYGYRMYAEDTGGEEVINNLRHSEWEAIEHVREQVLLNEKTQMFFMEGATIVTAYKETVQGNYRLFAVSSPENVVFWGLDRGFFEMFIILFLVAGGLAIAGILFCSQIVSRYLITRILKPLDQLNEATERIAAGNLEEKIAYQQTDEFKPVCDSFDLMQIELKNSMDKQLAYEKARTEMVSGISHDLRTPLTSIKGYLKGMLDGIANTEEKRQHYLMTAYKKSCDMEVLLGKLFYFSKLETGNMPFFCKKSDMKYMLEQYVENKSRELEEKNAKLVLEYDSETDVFCNIDLDQTRRVLDNLLENSLKYAEAENLIIKIKLEQSGRSMQIIVSDNGKGLAPEKMEHVFEQFYRGDESRTSKNDGNGLGLYVCKYIIEQQGGTIEAYNDSGFCVRIGLPLSEEGE